MLQAQLSGRQRRDIEKSAGEGEQRQAWPEMDRENAGHRAIVRRRSFRGR